METTKGATTVTPNVMYVEVPVVKEVERSVGATRIETLGLVMQFANLAILASILRLLALLCSATF